MEDFFMEYFLWKIVLTKSHLEKNFLSTSIASKLSKTKEDLLLMTLSFKFGDRAKAKLSKYTRSQSAKLSQPIIEKRCFKSFTFKFSP